MKFTGRVSGNKQVGFIYEVFYGGYGEDLGEPLKSEEGFKMSSEAYDAMHNYINEIGEKND